MIPDHIRQMFAVFAVTYPKWELLQPDRIEPAMKTWALMLRDIPADEVLKATTAHAQSSKFAPTVADIRDLAIHPADRGLTAEAAWGEVMNQIRLRGYMGKPTFSNPMVERAVEAVGGWYNLATQNTADVPANRAHFLRCYLAFDKTNTQDQRYLTASKAFDEIAGQLFGGTDRTKRLESMYGKNYSDDAEDPIEVADRERLARMKAEDPDSVVEDPN